LSWRHFGCWMASSALDAVDQWWSRLPMGCHLFLQPYTSIVWLHLICPGRSILMLISEPAFLMCVRSLYLSSWSGMINYVIYPSVTWCNRWFWM
jgi:hypothetical protein